jgi:hypothetical protein
MEVFKNPKRVYLKTSRWNVLIEIIDENGDDHVFVASADSGVADSGIYFATKKEYDLDVERLW